MKNLKSKILSQRLLVAILALAIMCSISLGTVAALPLSNGATTEPTVILNGTVLRFEDSEGNKMTPVMVDGKLYLPAEGVANLLGIQHEEGEENTAIWHDPTAQAKLNSTKEGLIAGYRIRVSTSPIFVTMEHKVNQTVAMTAIESTHAFNTMWIQLPEGRTGTMAITVGNTGKAIVRENRAGKLISSSVSGTVKINFDESKNVNVEGIQKAEGNDQMEEAENEWDGMPLTVKVYNDETDELLVESRLEKGHQVEVLVVEITGVNILRLEAHPDIEGWREAQARVDAEAEPSEGVQK